MIRVRAIAATVGVLAVQATADAQFPAATGTAVGRPLLAPVGQAVPAAAPRAGQPIGYAGPDGRTIDTVRPPGKVVDLKNLAAPLTAPLPPGLAAEQPKSAWEKLYDRWAVAIGLDKPKAQSSTWTPGLARRARERREQAWRRD